MRTRTSGGQDTIPFAFVPHLLRSGLLSADGFSSPHRTEVRPEESAGTSCKMRAAKIVCEPRLGITAHSHIEKTKPPVRQDVDSSMKYSGNGHRRLSRPNAFVEFEIFNQPKYGSPSKSSHHQRSHRCCRSLPSNQRARCAAAHLSMLFLTMAMIAIAP